MKKPGTIKKVNQTRVSAVKKYIDLHYREELPLADLAALVSVGPMSLSHIFKAETGTRLSDYIIDVRLRHAVAMLQETEMTVRTISYECGFNTLTNFNRLFKSRLGCTPIQMREQRNKKD